MDHSPLLCHRCGTELHPGSGDFYVVRIEAFADPSPPVIEEADPDPDPRRELDRLAEQLSTLSPQEAMDQVYRRLTIYLCVACYRPWIENPAGA
ncbi:MAG TPA: hypothetical protein PKG54_12540 [Phycisphaerae bacterium]|jgi:hypothetical protein|nr:hypothetical protein [Phycisphaerae bacterium]HOB75339.1 hypothetical protein [Phycisphaerae bacterium]HOJ53225.1 hypothetical protein [Phycisphaerae bacterium]HOL25189.1 hypothetical protein [Phycisphaerae bacterium]HPP20257.1 hypothetical protein [Phycisphaerae bacterium]